jgi:Domain of unknown function (DUF5979)/Domain of unknown function DUF11
MSGRNDSDSANVIANLGSKMRAAEMKMPIGVKACLAAITGRAAVLLLPLLLSLMTVAASVDQAVAQPANPYQFEKKAFKPDGTPWSGPVHPGDIIKYVLSYKPGTSNSGPVTIDDTLSPNQTYLTPTKASDPSWTWGGSPYSTGNHETYKHPGFGPSTGKVKVTVSGVPTPTFKTGDGTKPVPLGNNVFGVYHHALGSNANAEIDCWDLVTLLKCPGYPKSNGAQIATPQEPGAVVRDGKIFFAGALGSETGQPTIGCFDPGAPGPCADTTLTAVNAGGYATFGGLSEDPVSKRVFAIVKNKVFCRIWDGSTWVNCDGGWALSGTDAVPTAQPTDFTQLTFNVVGVHVEQSAAPSRVYAHVGSSIVQCLDILTGLRCDHWPSDGVTLNSGNAVGATFSSVPAGADENGICLWTRQGGVVGCVDSVGHVQSNPAAVGGNVISTFRIPGTGRVYFGQHGGSGAPVCMDYAGTTGGACSGFQSAAPPPSGGVSPWTYGFALDPLQREKCMLALGHTNWLWRFDWHTGQVGCETPTTVQTPKIENPYCNSTADSAGFHWNSIHVLTAGAAGELAITQGTNPPVLLTISSGTTNYPMPSGIGPGSGQLSFSFTPAAGAPTTADFEIGYRWDKNPEICYQAKVTCGPVFNTAVFKGSFNGSAISVSQKVDLGPVRGPECEPPKLTGCLKDMKVAVKCNPNGTYTVTLAGGGFSGNDITLTSQTAGVTVTPPLQPDAPSTTWTISGATAGETVVLAANATKVGGGKEDGTDQCCSGEITLVLPDCPKPPIDVAIGKENKPAAGQGNAFNIWVTNVGAPINFPAGAGGLTVTDVIPPGMTITGVTAPNWTCKPLPLTGPGTMTCTYNLGGSLATGAQLSDAIVVNAVITNHEQPLKNCAQIAIGATVGLDTNPSNNEACVPITGTGIGRLVVEKRVKNGTNASNAMIDAMVFPIGVTCGPPSNLNASFGLHNGGSHTESNIAVGSVCKVTEAISTLPAAPPRRICGDGLTAVWAPPVITPTSATIGSGTTVVTVVNELTCKRTGEGSLVVTKKVIDHSPLPIPASQTYPVTVTCGGIVKNLTLVEGVSQSVSNIPLGTSCSVIEGTVPTLPNVCPVRTTPVWSTADVPPSPVVVNAATTAVTIVNTLTCSQLQGCLPPLIPGAIPGTCDCPRGDVLVGKECVKPPICLLPHILIGVQCICPPGTVQQGKDCVKQPICLPSQILVEGQCVCPPGTVLKGRECVRPIDCLPGQILIGGKCVCPPGSVQQGQACVKPGCDLPGMITGPGGRCICPPGMVEQGQGRRCVPRIECRPPLIPNPAGTDCVCRPGLVQKGRRCVEPVVCKPPATLNRDGECQCPRDMVAKGNSCVERERPPTVTPGVPPRGGGRDNEPPRGGHDNGPPRGGHDNGPPRGGGRDNDPPRGGQGLDLPGRR